MSCPRFAAWMLPLVLTMGCASTSQDSTNPPRVVNGQGSAADRSAIQSTNEQIYKAEHGGGSDASTTPNGGIP